MIKSKNDVLNKIESFLLYSINDKPRHEDEYRDLSEDFKEAVNDYYGTDRNCHAKALMELQHGLYSYHSMKGTTYDPPTDIGLGSIPPEANDVSKFFYTFPLWSCTDADFHASWVYEWEDLDEEPTDEEKEKIYWRIIEVEEKKETNGTTGETKIKLIKKDVLCDWSNDDPSSYLDKRYIYQKEVVINNTKLDEWTEDVEDESTDKEAQRLSSFNLSLSNSMTYAGSTLLWEDDVVSISTPKRKDIAKSIFIDANLLNCVKYLQLPVRIPSYLC